MFVAGTLRAAAIGFPLFEQEDMLPCSTGKHFLLEQSATILWWSSTELSYIDNLSTSAILAPSSKLYTEFTCNFANLGFIMSRGCQGSAQNIVAILTESVDCLTAAVRSESGVTVPPSLSSYG